MADKPSTAITLAVTREGKPIVVNVEMTAEDVRAALIGGAVLVQLPVGDGRYTYVNPAHVAMVQETTGDEVMVAVF